MLKAARRSIGLTQAEAAKRAGVSVRTVGTLETGNGSIAAFEDVAGAVEFRLAGLPKGRTTGARVKNARLKRGWTQADLAERAGLAVKTVRAVEHDAGAHQSSLVAILRVVGREVRARKAEKANWDAGRRDVRFTPAWLIDEVVTVFGPISTDPCSADGSFVHAGRHIFEAEDGLATPWEGPLAFVNPPYSAAAQWLERCYQAWVTGEVETVVALVPVRTNTKVFHERCAGVADIVFMKGRPNFVNPFAPEVSGQIPFGTALIIWGADAVAARKLATNLDGRLMERDVQVAA
jgi:transcriptional regulator with XRE-family HTH domain